MSSPNERARNNVRAGIFVTLVLAAAFFVIITLGEAGSLVESMSSYTVRFTVSAGVEGLNAGSEVRVGGVRMGKVTGEPRLVVEGSERRILVPIEVDSSVTLYADAKAVRTAPLLGNIAAINFASVGTPDQPVLAKGATLDAVVSAGMLDSFLGPESADDTRQIITNFRTLSDRLPQDYDTRIVPMIDGAGDFVASVKEDYERWRVTLDKVMDKALSIVDSVDQTALDIRTMVADNRPDIDATIDNIRATSEDIKVAGQDVKEITGAINDVTIGKVHALLDKGSEALGEFQSVGGTVHEWIDATIPVLDQTMADARLASTQIKLAGIEIRRSPWKILYRPAADELQHELLYEAARSFALAASDLKAASESVDRLMSRHGTALREDRTVFEQVQKSLAGSFEKYQQAQQRLIDVLLTPAP